MKYCSVFSLLMLLACGRATHEQVVTQEVAKGEFVIAVEGEGHLRAVKATPILVPPANRPFTLSWMVPEGGFVAKGDKVVTFDASEMQLKQEELQSELRKIGYDTALQGRGSALETSDLDGQIELLHQERQQALDFAPRDERLYTRNQIIESEVDIGFLGKKVDYYGGKRDRHLRKVKTNEDIQNLNRKSQEVQLQQVTQNLQSLEVLAPNDGYFYPEFWGDEPISVGRKCWPGMKIGELPDMTTAEAVVYILEKEASGVRADLDAEITLDARPGFPYKAKVKQVAPLAKAVDRRSPVKYFEVVLTLLESDSHFMHQGGIAKARIFIDRQDNVIALPNQIFFHDDKTNWVYVKKGQNFEKCVVTLGRRGPNRTVVESGLEAGAQVAMSDPTQEAKP